MRRLPISGGNVLVTAWTTPASTSREMPKASAAETSASSRLSVSNCRMTRRATRQSPAGCRSPAAVRPRERATDWRHSRIRYQDEAEREKQRHEHHHDVDRQRDRALSRFEREARRGPLDEARGRPVDRTFSRMPRVPHAELRERLAARQPGFSRPTMLTLTDSARSSWPGRNWPSAESGAQKSGAATASSPRKSSGITPTIRNCAPFIRTVRLSTAGSPAKCRDQARWLRTMTGRAPG